VSEKEHFSAEIKYGSKGLSVSGSQYFLKITSKDSYLLWASSLDSTVNNLITCLTRGSVL
jgi:hypothetical protein